MHWVLGLTCLLRLELSPVHASPVDTDPSAAAATEDGSAVAADDTITVAADTAADTPATAPADSGAAAAQPSAELTSRPAITPPRSRRTSAAIVGGLYGGLTVWAYFAWYHNQPNIDFTVGGDGLFGSSTYAGGADKLGHFWANNVFTRISTEILSRGGWSRLPASLVAGGLTLSFFTFIEVKDGYYYSFSLGDEAANALGACFAILAANVPAVDRALDFRVDYSPSSEYWHALTNDGDVNIAEDYSGQTYHLAFHLGSVEALRRTSKYTRYIDVMAAFRATGYKPTPAAQVLREQDLFFGIGLNAQALLADWFGTRSGGATAGQLATEFFSVPYATVRVAGADRSPDAP